MHISESILFNNVVLFLIWRICWFYSCRTKKISLRRIHCHFWWLMDKIYFTKIRSCITVLNLKNIWHAHYSYLISCSWLVIIMNLNLYEDKYSVDYFIKRIESTIIFITQLIDARCSWHWTSSQPSSLILIVLGHYFTKLK